MSQFLALPGFSLSIKRKISGIALALILLMTAASVLSMVMVRRVSAHFTDLSANYIPAYGDLARANIRSLERALTLRRMVIMQLESLNNAEKFETLRETLNAKGHAVEEEIRAARVLIGGLIQKGDTFGDEAALVRIDSRLDDLLKGSRHYLNEEIDRLLSALKAKNARAASQSMERVDEFRDDVNRSLDSIRSDMLALLQADGEIMARAHR
ncbi:hypothetical protein [Methylocystis sp.]|uniref:hypothetical protein n=1 Tax=Methylocystis sp. TaxID=1911079 RepID=UPI00345C1029